MQVPYATEPWLQVAVLPSKHRACPCLRPHLISLMLVWPGWTDECCCCCWLWSWLGLLSQAGSLHPAGGTLQSVVAAGA